MIIDTNYCTHVLIIDAVHPVPGAVQVVVVVNVVGYSAVVLIINDDYIYEWTLLSILIL